MNEQAILKKLEGFTMPAKEAGLGKFPKSTLKYLYFTGKSVVATDSHWLAILKDYPSKPCLGTAAGPVSDVCDYTDYPDYKKVLIQTQDIGWSYTWKKDTEFLKRLTAFLSGAERAVRDKKPRRFKGIRYGRGLLLLRKKGGDFSGFMAHVGLEIHARFLCGLDGDGDFEGFYSLPGFLRALDFLHSVSGNSDFTLYVKRQPVNAKAGPLITMETPEALVLGTPMSRISEYDLVRMAARHEEAMPTLPDDLDFLD